jgi:hypothetical protein
VCESVCLQHYNTDGFQMEIKFFSCLSYATYDSPAYILILVRALSTDNIYYLTNKCTVCSCDSVCCSLFPRFAIHTIKLLRNQLCNITKHVLIQIPCKFAAVTAFDLYLAGVQFYSHLMNQLSLFRFFMAFVTHSLNITVTQISSLLLCSTSFPIEY